MPSITGILALNNKGKGYVRPLQSTPSKKEDSIGIPSQFILDALPGDTVVVETFPTPNKWGEIEGKIREIKTRGSANFVAIVTEVTPTTIYAKPDNQKLSCLFALTPDPSIQVAVGEKVFIAIDWSKKPKVTIAKNQTPEGYFNTEVAREFYGRILEIFGMQGEHLSLIHI